jgi:hypothetical protein
MLALELPLISICATVHNIQAMVFTEKFINRTPDIWCKEFDINFNRNFRKPPYKDVIMFPKNRNRFLLINMDISVQFALC